MVRFDAEFVVSAPKVLDERVTTDHDRSGPVCSQSALWFQSCFETAMVPLDPVDCVLLGVVYRFWDQLVDDAEQGRSRASGDLSGSSMGVKHRFEELACCSNVASFRDVHVDDLTVLINGSVYVAPDAGDLDIGLVHEPAVTHRVTTRPGGVDEQGREALHPAVDGDVIDLNSTLGEEFLDIAGQQP